MTDEERKQFINEYCRNVGNTKIRCDDCKFVEDCVDYGWDGCRKFTPKRSTPMTNEEWLRSAPFEELAGAIYEWYSSGWVKGKNKKSMKPITEVVEWLKQPHTNE